MILEAFFEVNGAGRLQEVQALLSKREFDLVVLCHSLTESDCRRISEFVNCQSNRPKILMLRATGSDLVRPGADEDLGAEAGPYVLLTKVAEMLDFDLKAKPPTAAAIRSSSTDVRTTSLD